MKKTKKVALVGMGFMGNMHAQVYQQLDMVELVAIVDYNRNQVKDKVQKLGIEIPVFTEFSKLIESNIDFDIVDICSPTDQHEELAIKTSQAGKHLFIEKPLSLSLESCTAIQNAVEDNNVIAQVGHCIRFWPEYQALEAFVKSKQGGKLKSLSLLRRAGRTKYSETNWLNKESRSGGASFDLHIHDTDFVLHLLGMPEAVFSQTKSGISGPDHIFTQYIYDDVMVQAEGGWDYSENYGFYMGFEAVFENASISYDSNAEQTLMITLEDSVPQAMTFSNIDVAESTTGEGNLSSLGGYYNELKYFIECIHNQKQPKSATIEQSLQSVNVVLTELKSAKTKSIIYFN